MMVHEPFSLAAATLARPAGFIRPSLVSRRILSLLIFDQTLFGLRRVQYWR